MTCPRCSAVTPDGARFCEACGTSLVPDTPNSSEGSQEHCRCGAGPDAKGADGYCTVCGLRWPVPRAALPRDHIELSVTLNLAGVTDRGRRHPCNEDAMALAIEGESSILVVCDGVSSSQRADEASEASANSVCASLQAAVRLGVQDRSAVMKAAVLAGHEAACRVPTDPSQPKDPPGATVVAALVQDRRVILGWLGDSRAYWITPSEARLLTHDHSWVNAVVDAGEMSEAEALKSPEAHAITLCLGPLNGDDPGKSPEPSVCTVSLTGPGRLLLCTDGLWNYAQQIDEIAALVRQAPAGSDSLAVCRSLVDYALAKGGRDNITAMLLSL